MRICVFKWPNHLAKSPLEALIPHSFCSSLFLRHNRHPGCLFGTFSQGICYSRIGLGFPRLECRWRSHLPSSRKAAQVIQAKTNSYRRSLRDAILGKSDPLLLLNYSCPASRRQGKLLLVQSLACFFQIHEALSKNQANL